MELTDVRKNGDLRWLRPDGKTQVAIEYVPKVVDEIIEVVRLIPQERVKQRIVEQIVHVPVPQVVEEVAEMVQIIPPGAYIEAYHRPNRRCASGDATPSIAHPGSAKDVGSSTSAFP